MSLFRKKPVVVEAERFMPDPRDVGWPRRWPDGVVEDTQSATGYAIDTLEGRALEVAPGDWIITGVQGERYPCKPDVFEQTYEAVEAAPHVPDFSRLVPLLAPVSSEETE